VRCIRLRHEPGNFKGPPEGAGGQGRGRRPGPDRSPGDLLDDKVLPFFEQQELPMLRILIDRGTE